ncbi:MAG TPA: ABC transporter permease [Gemmatimonadales bacterium]|nr:ABC transporter permease [Gemmatimonadales bacterium]
METLIQDVRYALRQLRTHPGFTAAVVLTLALGIGANTAVFGVVNAVLLKPLGYQKPDRLAIVWEQNTQHGVPFNVVNPRNYLDWKERAGNFTDLAAFGWSQLTFTGDAPESVQGRKVTESFFDVLGAIPERGRVFTAADGLPGTAPVVLISDGLWRRRFGADPQIVGRSVPVAGATVQVVGVMPASFRPMPWGAEEFWEPLRLDPGDHAHSGRYLMVVGRLKPGATVAQAQSELSGISAGLAQQYPAFNTGWGTHVVSLTDQVVGDSRRVLWILFGAVSMVLLIACANVGNLLLARAARRERELAVRAALGASKGRLVRQWVIESVVLSGLGGAAGLLLASWGLDLLVAAAPGGVPRLAEISVDGTVFLVTAFVSLTVGLAFGLFAALRDRGDIESALRGESGRTTSGAAAARMRNGLVVAQVAFAFVLLIGAGLLVRSLANLSSINPGFDPANVVGVSLVLPDGTYPTGPQQEGFYRELVRRVRAMPGVEGAGVVNFPPLIGPNAATTFTVVGRPAPAPGQTPGADIRSADSGYFEAMRIPLLRGRLPRPSDGPGAPPVVVINQTMAKRFWPGADPIGQHLQVSWTDPKAQPEIVGVVGDVHGRTLDSDLRPAIYYPLTQSPTGAMTLVARHAGDPEPLTKGITTSVHQLDPALPVTGVATMSSLVAASMSDRRYPMILLAVFAALAVVLSAVGIYGVLTYTVAQRVREIGVRMALGARGLDVVRLVLTGGLRPTLLGIVVGGIGAVLGARALGSLLYGVTPADPGTFAGVSILFVCIALFAMYLPAQRATRVDPIVTLRSE